MEQEFKTNQLPGPVDGKVYIYGLVDPRTQELRYVGKTIDAYHRYYDHMRARKNSHLRNWLRQVKACGFETEMFIIETVTKEEWPDAERFWIGYFEYIGANLCNRHGGGWGGNYKPFTEEHRRKIGEAHRGMKRPPMTEEHRKKIGDASRGKKRGPHPGTRFGPHSDESKQKMSRAKRGKKVKNKTMPPLSEKHKANISAALKGRPSPTKGMKFGPLSEERRAHLSLVKTGVKKPPFTDEHRRKLSESKTGKKYPPRSEEARRNYSEAAKRRHARERAEREKKE